MTILANKVAVITGSTRGLGRAIAEAYAREGAAVVISSRSPAAVTQTVEQLQAEGFRASGISCDVGDSAQVGSLARHAIDAFGGFDIWVNNAGLSSPYGPTIAVAPEAFTRVIQTNILGTYYGSLAAMQHFLERRQGKLINVLGRGDKKPVAMQNAYASSKTWMRSFTLALAQEYKKSGIGVYAFNPGLVDTDLLHHVSAVEGYEKAMKPLETVIRLWSNPPEIPASKALWLASSATDGKTGLEVNVLSPSRLIGGLAREAWRRLTGDNPAAVDLVISSAPANH